MPASKREEIAPDALALKVLEYLGEKGDIEDSRKVCSDSLLMGGVLRSLVAREVNEIAIGALLILP